jgi:hypothetical protein
MYCRKFDSAWHWWERPDNINIYHYQLYAPILKYLPVTFLLLAPPALVGLVLAGRRWRRRAALYLLVLTALAPLVVFNVPARYRLLLIAAVSPFAAMAVAETVRWLWMRRWVKGGTVLAIMLLLSLWTGRPLPEHVTLVRVCDPATAFEAYYLEPLNEALRNRDWARAAAIMEDFLKVEPDPVPSLGPGRPAVSWQKSRMALLYAEAHADCGRLYQAAGDAQAAEKHQRRAAELLEARQTAPAP